MLHQELLVLICGCICLCASLTHTRRGKRLQISEAIFCLPSAGAALAVTNQTDKFLARSQTGGSISSERWRGETHHTTWTESVHRWARIINQVQNYARNIWTQCTPNCASSRHLVPRFMLSLARRDMKAGQIWLIRHIFNHISVKYELILHVSKQNESWNYCACWVSNRAGWVKGFLVKWLVSFVTVLQSSKSNTRRRP